MKINLIAKNTSYLTLALVLQKIISFFYFTILARNLGPENLGKYYFAISFTTIFAIFIDFGLTNVLTREVAKNKRKTEIILGSCLFIKIFFSFFVVIFLFLFSYFLLDDNLVKKLVYISSICMILDSFTNTFYGTIRGFHNLFFESIGSVIFQIIVLLFGLIFIYLNFGLVWIIFSLVLGSVFNFLFSYFSLKKKIKINIIPIFDKNFIIFILKLAFPFSLFAIFQRFYTYFDTVILLFLTNEREVGFYQVAFKIIFALQFLPMAFVASLYPAMSKYWCSNREQLVISFERAMSYLIIISLPISVGIISLVDKIILIFKEDFLDAVLSVQIVLASLVFIFINYPIGSLLNACDHQKRNTINMIIVTLFSVILNFLLISKFKAVGASLTVFFSNFLMFILGIFKVKSIINFNLKKILFIFIKSFFSVVLMFCLIILLKNNINIFLIIPISAFFYFSVLFILRGFSKQDLFSILDSFYKK